MKNLSIFIIMSCIGTLSIECMDNQDSPTHPLKNPYTLQILEAVHKSTDKTNGLLPFIFNSDQLLKHDFESLQTFQHTMWSVNNLCRFPEPYHLLNREHDAIEIETVIPILCFNSLKYLIDHVPNSKDELLGPDYRIHRQAVAVHKQDHYSQGEFMKFACNKFDNPAMRYKTSLPVEKYALFMAIIKKQ